MLRCSMMPAVAAGQGLPRSYGSWSALVQVFALVVAGLALAGPLAGTAAGADRPVRIVALGDSLTAGLGLPANAAFPARLEQALKAKGLAVEIINAGVSGDTASGGLARLDWSVPEGTDAVIVELGANDTLRGIDPKVTREALDGIVGRLRQRRIGAARRHAGGAQSRRRTMAAISTPSIPTRGPKRPPALSVFPRRRRHRRQAQPARRPASDRGRRRCDRCAHPAESGRAGGAGARQTRH